MDNHRKEGIVPNKGEIKMNKRDLIRNTAGVQTFWETWSVNTMLR